MKINPDVKFYDTCSLLLAGESLFDTEQRVVISSITLNELENIKTSAHKDADVKYNARILLRFLEEHPDAYDVIIHKTEYEAVIKDADFDITPDMKILSDAIWCNNNMYIDSTIFVTNDLSLKHIANLFFGDRMIQSVKEEPDSYKGYKEISIDYDTMAKFYQDISYNHFNLLIGEYLILKDEEGNIVDVRVWTGDTHRNITTRSFNSQWFGKVSPFNGDIYQKLLFDSLLNNKITMVKGPAGSGKTQVSLGFLMSQLEDGHIDKIIIFCNTVATANSAKLGLIIG